LESIRSRVPGAALRASYYSLKQRFFDQLVDLAAAEPGQDSAKDALLASERGRARALLDLVAEGSILHQIPAELLNRRAALQRRLDLFAAAMSNASAADQRRIREQIETTVAEDEEAQAAIHLQLEGQELGRPLASPEQLQAL